MVRRTTTPSADYVPEPLSIQLDTPSQVIEELKAACRTKVFTRFTSAFNQWLPHKYRISELDAIMVKAMECNNAKVVSQLLASGMTLFHDYASRAIRHQATDVVELLLQEGWDINQPNSRLEPSALGFGVGDEFMAPTVRPYRGGNVHQGQLFHHAVNWKSGVVEVLKMLLEKGASINAKKDEDPHLEGADMSIRDLIDRTALDWAVNNNHQEVVGILENAMAMQCS
ncbi:hypothetical protein BDW59DRAFT_174908 [Aspergillus cavernicola]|uniref:Ankyrin repeat-containing domain protein n=1 Tax=Aspergillus cavernicola TaxID=176166 RepID=A0ABR4HUZ5_9EURO